MFASAFVATKYTVGSVPPLLAAALRFTAAAVVLSAFLATQVRARRSGLEPIRPSDRLRVVILGLLGIFAYHALFFWALQFTSASLSALIVPTTLPLATALMARVILGEPLGPYGLAGVAVATVGVALAVGRAPETAARGPAVGTDGRLHVGNRRPGLDGRGRRGRHGHRERRGGDDARLGRSGRAPGGRGVLCRLFGAGLWAGGPVRRAAYHDVRHGGRGGAALGRGGARMGGAAATCPGAPGPPSCSWAWDPAGWGWFGITAAALCWARAARRGSCTWCRCSPSRLRCFCWGRRCTSGN